VGRWAGSIGGILHDRPIGIAPLVRTRSPVLARNKPTN